MPLDILSHRDLSTAYDGAIPSELTDLAEARTYHAYLVTLAHQAEQRFSRRVRETLAAIVAWRMTPHPYQFQRLRLHANLMMQYRHKAREAFDLCQ